MPFKKGQSGNPAGTPANKPFLDALNRAIKQGDSKKLRSAADKLLDAAAAGEPWAVKELRDTLDGKPAQAHQISAPDGGPILVQASWLAERSL